MTTNHPAIPPRINVEMHGAEHAEASARMFADHRPPFATLRIGETVSPGFTFYGGTLDDLREMLHRWIAAVDSAANVPSACPTCRGTGMAARCVPCGTRRSSGAVCDCGSSESYVVGCPNCEPEGVL